MSFFSILGDIVGVVPGVKDLWYAIKKDVPRVPCYNCKNAAGQSTGKVSVLSRDQDTGKETEVIITCPICNGSGKIRSTEVK